MKGAPSEPAGMPRGIAFERLFLFNLANNHLGDAGRGRAIIRQISAVAAKYDFAFAFRFQTRNPETLIQPVPAGNGGRPRCVPLELSMADIVSLKNEAAANGFAALFTAYDEASVDMLVEHGFDAVGIAACSFTDWPLLEKVARTSLPVVASTAGVSSEDIERVHLFFKNRGRRLCLMHGVEEYPARAERLNLGRVGMLAGKFPGTPVGYCSHERPDATDSVKIAAAMGARVFERHVASAPVLPAFAPYSCLPEQIDLWLEAARVAFSMCGREEAVDSNAGHASPRGLMRGAYAARDLEKGAMLDTGDIGFAFPCGEGQFAANEMTKKKVFVLARDICANTPIRHEDLVTKDFGVDIAAQLPASFRESRASVGGVSCLRYSNTSGPAPAVVINVHGGGFVSGSAEGSRINSINLAGYSLCGIVAPDYRLAPEHPYPAAIEDVLAVYRGLLAEGRSPSDIGLYGESAGGGVALAAAMQLRDAGESLPGALVLSSPWVDLTNSGGSHTEEMNAADITLKTTELNRNARDYAGGAPLTDPRVSPLYGSFTGLPPMLLFAGTREVLLSDARRLAARAGEAGVPVTLRIVESMPHAFTSMTGVYGEAEAAMREIGEFFGQHLRNRSTART